MPIEEDLRACFAVCLRGAGSKTVMLVHGIGCDQAMWRYVSPAFERDFRVALFDFVGAGSRISALMIKRSCLTDRPTAA
jgi:sigma-B regulation protein RsbQ